MAVFGLAQGADGVAVAGEGALPDEIARAAVRGAFGKKAEFVGHGAGMLPRSLGFLRAARGEGDDFPLPILEGFGFGNLHVKGAAAVHGDAALVRDDFDLNGDHPAADHVEAM